MDDLNDWNTRFDYAREAQRGGPMAPTADHLTLLAASEWDWNDCEFGAVSMDPKRPYGNSDVDTDLAELLPHLDQQDRIRVHCELPAVLAHITRHLGRRDMAEDPIEQAAIILAAERHRHLVWADLSMDTKALCLQDARALAAAGLLATPADPDMRRITAEMAAGLADIAELVGLNRETDEPEVLVNRVRERLAAPAPPNETVREVVAEVIEQSFCDSDRLPANARAAIVNDLVAELHKAGVVVDPAGEATTDTVAAERLRQVQVKGFTTEHDLRYTHGELVSAALAHLTGDPAWWPWADAPEGRSAVKAGALLMAERDRHLAEVGLRALRGARL